jgi:hypothetical protein
MAKVGLTCGFGARDFRSRKAGRYRAHTERRYRIFSPSLRRRFCGNENFQGFRALLRWRHLPHGAAKLCPTAGQSFCFTAKQSHSIGPDLGFITVVINAAFAYSAASMRSARSSAATGSGS